MPTEKAPLQTWELSLFNKLYQTNHEIRFFRGDYGMVWEIGVFVKALDSWIEACGPTLGAAVRSLRKQIEEELNDLMQDHEIVVKVVKKGKVRKCTTKS